VAELIPFVIVLALIWLVLIRPQRRRRAAQKAMQARLRPGDEVLTIGGVFGRIEVLDEDEVSLEVAPGTSIRVDRLAVARVVAPDGGEAVEQQGSDPQDPR
jgi:preprotein translocase subunit YajC